MRRYLTQVNGGQALLYILLIVGIAMLLTILISSKTTKLRLEKKKYFFYILLQSLSFIVFAIILYNLKGTTITNRFISLQSYFVFAGSIHLYVFRNYFKKFDSKKIHTEIFIALVSALFIAAFMAAIITYFDQIGYLWYLMATLLLFVMPSLCYNLFETAISIPAKLHKRWFYPINSKYPSPQIAEMRNIIILNLVFQKKANDEQIINFKVKAPRAIDFGRLFYYFINDYNEKNPGGQINYLDDKNQPFGWYFHTKPKWFGSSEYIDPELAIDTNNLKDGETIICQRI